MAFSAEVAPFNAHDTASGVQTQGLGVVIVPTVDPSTWSPPANGNGVASYQVNGSAALPSATPFVVPQTTNVAQTHVPLTLAPIRYDADPVTGQPVGMGTPVQPIIATTYPTPMQNFAVPAGSAAPQIGHETCIIDSSRMPFAGENILRKKSPFAGSSVLRSAPPRQAAYAEYPDSGAPTFAGTNVMRRNPTEYSYAHSAVAGQSVTNIPPTANGLPTFPVYTPAPLPPTMHYNPNGTARINNNGIPPQAAPLPPNASGYFPLLPPASPLPVLIMDGIRYSPIGLPKGGWMYQMPPPPDGNYVWVAPVQPDGTLDNRIERIGPDGQRYIESQPMLMPIVTSAGAIQGTGSGISRGTGMELVIDTKSLRSASTYSERMHAPKGKWIIVNGILYEATPSKDPLKPTDAEITAVLAGKPLPSPLREMDEEDGLVLPIQRPTGPTNGMAANGMNGPLDFDDPSLPEVVGDYARALQKQLMKEWNEKGDFAGRLSEVKAILTARPKWSQDGKLLRAIFEVKVLDIWGENIPPLELKRYEAIFGSNGARTKITEPSIKIGLDMQETVMER